MHASSYDSQREAERQKEGPTQYAYQNNSAGGSSRVHFGPSYQHYEYHAPVYYHSDQAAFGEHRPQNSAVRREDVLDSFRYEGMDDHYLTIQPAYANTCQWLLNQDEYANWFDMRKLSDYHGFLWIKGKPGTGKTTLMKFAYQHARNSLGDRTLMSFFFNARRGGLECSTEGMYRSLLYQLLETIPRLQYILDKQNQRDHWPVKMLSNLFREAILALGKDGLVCYIDALD